MTNAGTGSRAETSFTNWALLSSLFLGLVVVSLVLLVKRLWNCGAHGRSIWKCGNKFWRQIVVGSGSFRSGGQNDDAINTICPSIHPSRCTVTRTGTGTVLVLVPDQSRPSLRPLLRLPVDTGRSSNHFSLPDHGQRRAVVDNMGMATMERCSQPSCAANIYDWLLVPIWSLFSAKTQGSSSPASLE